MEFTRFIIYCILASLSFGCTVIGFWQAYNKKINEKIRITELQSQREIERLKEETNEKIYNLEDEMRDLQKTVNQGMQERLSNIEGEMKGIRNTMIQISNWFIHNTPKR